jgi:hypothetical protein
MNFAETLYKYHSEEEVIAYCQLLEHLDIGQEINGAFDDYNFELTHGNKVSVIAQLALSCREYITCFHEALLKIKPNERYLIQEKVIALTQTLIAELLANKILSKYECTRILLKSAIKTFQKYGSDFNEFLNSINEQKSDTLVSQTTKQESSNDKKIYKPTYLDWNGKKHLDFFIDDVCKTFKGLKCKKKVYQLFIKTEEAFKIELPSVYLSAFLILFHELHLNGVIKVIGTRGLFVHLFRHMEAPSFDVYPNRDFRKLRHEAEQNIQKKSKIIGLLKPILDNHCTQLSLDDRWTIAEKR